MKVEQTQVDLAVIVRRIQDEEWDLQPDFQRGEVWDRVRRQRLIDTILREWYVPAVHIVVRDDLELVLDGQQRLVAIRDFFDDKIKVDGSLEPSNDRIRELNGLRYSELPIEVRRRINRFPVTVVKLTEYRPAEPNELFFRLNQSYNLTPAEKRNALYGDAQRQIRDLVRDLVEIGLLASDRIGFSNGRLAYDDIIARTCVVVEKNTIREHVNNNTVEEFYRSTAFREETLRAVADAGRALLDLLDAVPGGKVKFNKGTLQTWLVYCYWARALAPLPQRLLLAFEATRRSSRPSEGFPVEADPMLLDITRQYDDRASYRVTDVSSVQIRDLAIQLFSERVFGTPPRLGSERLLRGIGNQPGDSAAYLMAEYLKTEPWGAELIMGETS
ncbi:hypothetical protein ASG04_03090 [Curtobacterium sp. Leaf183]|uniref:DUF262 domain-containing protein n=1 Tax=Curtobacterium sp. Leaf183 TaxID=1736291 RepID=UPI000701AD1D|nr:DUF262 domain-containing protein [Curtobacterium sp. Leaf183]KQS14821.1 hypothetical protein ASG04_03090 [Curtobacterium sp. Leaf183]